MTQSMLIPMFTPMLCDYDQGSPAIKADMAHQSGAGELGRPLHAMEANFFCLGSAPPLDRGPKSGGAYACECLQQHDAAARRKGRGCAATRSGAQLMPYGRHCGSGLRRCAAL